MIEKYRVGTLSYKGKKLFEQRAWAVVMGLRYSFFCHVRYSCFMKNMHGSDQ